MNEAATIRPRRGVGGTFLWFMVYAAVACLSVWDSFIDRSHSYSWAQSITFLAAVVYPFLPKRSDGPSGQGFLQYLQVPVRVAFFVWLALALFDLTLALLARGLPALIERAPV
jgi:hypothetical protein